MKKNGYEILDIISALNVLATKELKLSSAYIVAKNIKALSVIEELINNKRKIIIDKYAEKDENGNIVSNENGIRITDTNKFNDEINTLLSEEVEIELTKIKMSDIENITISPADVYRLMDMIEE